MIRVRALELCFAGAAAPVLQGLSFEVREGALAVIVGASGAGKTTLLRCLAGLQAFDRGAIEVDGLAVGAAEDGEARHRRLLGWAGPARAAQRTRLLEALRGKVGLVFQSFELFPHLSVLDNLTLAPRRAKGVARADAEARARRLLSDLGLADKHDAFPEQLSGGQRQRVAIARALALEPRVLLYDEPTSALDPSLRGEVVATLRRVRAAGMTQIVVSHDRALAREAADEVLVLDGGRIVAQGAAEVVLGVGG
jgi:polar amino acid transport system ATP-binding protein